MNLPWRSQDLQLARTLKWQDVEIAWVLFRLLQSRVLPRFRCTPPENYIGKIKLTGCLLT